MIVLDANVLIAAFDSSDLHHEWAITFLRDTAAEELMISTLTYAEILVAPIRADRLKEFRKGIDSLGFIIDDIASEDAEDIARLRSETGLKMPDVIVLHTALKHAASLATADSSLTRKAAALGTTVFSPSI
ncbi:putative nucleic acid-binding protein [Aurantimicrobium minutum]|uniref:type II toxin-antitoxin system VapC family toxin n=1 Tax=Aurantimicrobium minutum TaxID=708131 RepID=UPI0024744EF7|nr:type II toxin-antitoxin system VapC family toxin [Aurantimicrobium minutum]MDH6277547.1 putative nucleic acid-binding protein [Aurantimicrobium minutum]